MCGPPRVAHHVVPFLLWRRYKAALRACPTAPPEVRLGIAACSLKLGNTGTAELAYQRVLDLAPDCTPALLGLAVLKLHVSSDEQVRRRPAEAPCSAALCRCPCAGSGCPVCKAAAHCARLPPLAAQQRLPPASSQHAAADLPASHQLPRVTAAPRCTAVRLQGVREGSRLLAQAFDQDPENPFVLLLLAHFCLRQGYADKVRRGRQGPAVLLAVLRTRQCACPLLRVAGTPAWYAACCRGVQPLAGCAQGVGVQRSLCGRPSPALWHLQARALAETVQAHGGSAAMQAEACTLLGRACHALGQLNDAYRFYQQVGWGWERRGQGPVWRGQPLATLCCSATGAPEHLQSPVATRIAPPRTLQRPATPCPARPQATHVDGKLPLPRLGLAQMNVLQDQAVNAASLLESVLVDAPQWIDALEVRPGSVPAGS